jgi:hypothetical protein
MSRPAILPADNRRAAQRVRAEAGWAWMGAERCYVRMDQPRHRRTTRAPFDLSALYVDVVTERKRQRLS